MVDEGIWVRPAETLEGRIDVPGDKSVSHRLAILGAMAKGQTSIENFSTSLDCQSSLGCVEHLGAIVRHSGRQVQITSPGWRGLKQPGADLDVGNSGTTIRLLSALLAARPMVTRIGGDSSLNQRPMRRIINPLSRMGAVIRARGGQFPPLEIQGGQLAAIHHHPEVASAQVKSCVLLAGLMAEGETTVVETKPTRDHTERLLPLFGAPVKLDGNTIRVHGPAELKGCSVKVPGDFSSAIFFVVAALLIAGSKIVIRNVGVNPSRTGLLRLLEESGASITRQNDRLEGVEPVADLVISGKTEELARLPAQVGGEIIPNIIDEIPVLAVLATRMPQGLRVRDASELRKKESDRIHSVVSNLRSLGVGAEESADGFYVPYTPALQGGKVNSYGDHRIAMAFSILGLVSNEGVTVDNPACAAVSFPGFFERLNSMSKS